MKCVYGSDYFGCVLPIIDTYFILGYNVLKGFLFGFGAGVGFAWLILEIAMWRKKKKDNAGT